MAIEPETEHVATANTENCDAFGTALGILARLSFARPSIDPCATWQRLRWIQGTRRQIRETPAHRYMPETEVIAAGQVTC